MHSLQFSLFIWETAHLDFCWSFLVCEISSSNVKIYSLTVWCLLKCHICFLLQICLTLYAWSFNIYELLLDSSTGSWNPLTHFGQRSHFVPTENKPKVFWCFQGLWIWNIGQKSLNLLYTSSESTNLYILFLIGRT